MWHAAPVPICFAMSGGLSLPSVICCRVPTLKEVLSLVNAAQRAGKTVGVAIHTLVRCAAVVTGFRRCWRPDRGMGSSTVQGT